MARKSLHKQYDTNPEKMRDHDRKWRYGMEPGQFVQMVREQDGSCAVCRKKPATHVDHDHTTGNVRGILCNHCNMALGCMNDDPKRLASAVDYLVQSMRKQIVDTLSKRVEVMG